MVVKAPHTRMVFGLLLATPRDDTITPRVPSHARRNNRQINHLDIGNLLPSPSPQKKPTAL